MHVQMLLVRLLHGASFSAGPLVSLGACSPWPAHPGRVAQLKPVRCSAHPHGPGGLLTMINV